MNKEQTKRPEAAVRRILASSLPLLLAGLALSGCSNDEQSRTDIRTTESLSFEEWKEKVRLKQGADIYAVGDRVSPLGLLGDDEARAYFDRHVEQSNALTVHNGQTGPGTPINVSAFPPGTTLTACIDKPSFDELEDFYGLPAGSNLFAHVDTAFTNAAAIWNAVPGITIGVDGSRENSCTPRSNDNITWYVRPMVPEGTVEYFTFVLHPNHNQASHNNREFLVWDYIAQRHLPGAFVADNDPNLDDAFSLEGLFLRAIGNGLGFIDESNRGGVSGDSGENIWSTTCRDQEVGGVFLSDADPFSFTTHPLALSSTLDKPECTGLRERDYALSYLDAMGAACQYAPSDTLFYFCSSQAQRAVADRQDPRCSPFPLFPGAAGDCNDNDDHSWSDARVARAYHAAVIEALL